MLAWHQLAYHGSVMPEQALCEIVVSGGELLPASMRKARTYGIQSLDKLAGDDKYLFFSLDRVYQPRRRPSIALGFDARSLLERGGHLRTGDLYQIYERAVERHGYEMRAGCDEITRFTPAPVHVAKFNVLDPRRPPGWNDCKMVGKRYVMGKREKVDHLPNRVLADIRREITTAQCVSDMRGAAALRALERYSSGEVRSTKVELMYPRPLPVAEAKKVWVGSWYEDETEPWIRDEIPREFKARTLGPEHVRVLIARCSGRAASKNPPARDYVGQQVRGWA